MIPGGSGFWGAAGEGAFSSAQLLQPLPNNSSAGRRRDLSLKESSRPRPRRPPHPFR